MKATGQAPNRPSSRSPLFRVGSTRRMSVLCKCITEAKWRASTQARSPLAARRNRSSVRWWPSQGQNPERASASHRGSTVALFVATQRGATHPIARAPTASTTALTRKRWKRKGPQRERQGYFLTGSPTVADRERRVWLAPTMGVDVHAIEPAAGYWTGSDNSGIIALFLSNGTKRYPNVSSLRERVPPYTLLRCFLHPSTGYSQAWGFVRHPREPSDVSGPTRRGRYLAR